LLAGNKVEMPRSHGKHNSMKGHLETLQSNAHLVAHLVGTATSLNNLAALYESQGKYAQAEPLYVRALAIYEQQLGAEHPGTATSLNNLATLYRVQGKYAQAEPLAICEKSLGQDHPSTQTVRQNYAFLLQTMERERKHPD
jgi:Flp pilus assembly protein TadD